jgi:molybdenum cofactor cytidylyltransferase
MTPGILITAAGLGTRYRAAGGCGLKLDQELADGLSVFQLTLRNACESGLPVHVVTRPSYASIQADCRAMGATFSCHETRCLGETIAQGVRHCVGWNGWLIQLADMPFVSAGMHRLVATALQHHACARPFYRQSPGHPVGFGAVAREKLLQLHNADGAQAVFQHFPPYSISVVDEGVIKDVDLPSQLNRKPC